MNLRHGKVPPPTLAILAGLAALGYFLVETRKVEVPEKDFAAKKRAVEIAVDGQKAIKAARRRAGVEIYFENDPLHTGLIGADDSGPLTTDKGDLRAKHIATNPNLAAVVVSLLTEAGVKKGDIVAVGLTGSFPGANLAVLAAIQALEAKAVVITSVGSSTFGANHAEFTWLDMERALVEAGVTRTRSVAASVGGDKDKGVGLNKATIEMIGKAIQRNEVEKIEARTLVDSIKKRMAIYDREAAGREIRCYVNVGGGLASIGSSAVGKKLIHTGLTDKYVVRNYPTEGVMIKMLKKGIPVIHLLDFRKLGEKYRLKGQAQPEEIGTGELFMSKRYNLWLVVGTLVVLALLVGAAVRLDLKHTLLKPPPGGGDALTG